MPVIPELLVAGALQAVLNSETNKTEIHNWRRNNLDPRGVPNIWAPGTEIRRANGNRVWDLPGSGTFQLKDGTSDGKGLTLQLLTRS